MKEHEAALRSYDEALSRLYGSSVSTLVEPGGDVPALADVDAALVEDALLESERVGDTAAKLLRDDDPSVREMGEAQLAALAATDFAVAVDLAAQDEEVQASAKLALPQARGQVAFVLDADLREGTPVDGASARRVRALAEGDDNTPAALIKTVDAAFDTVRDEVEEVIKAGAKGMAEAGLDAALGAAASGVFAKLPDNAKRALRWAMGWIRKGVEKLMKLLGKEALEAIRKWLGEHGIDAVLDWAYETKDLKAECAERVQGASPDKDFAAAGEAIQKVVGKHGSQKKVILEAFKWVGRAHKVLTVLWPPQAPLIAGAAYGVGVGYGIVSGGDYVDWRRFEDVKVLDRVAGIRKTLDTALA
ncbi:MAG TPA: hypothetical protein VF715_07610 [Thermoleophilaceae bacterium]